MSPLKIDVTCDKCGASLTIENAIMQSTFGDIDIKVAPCQSCLEKAEESGNEAGYESGKEEGYDAGYGAARDEYGVDEDAIYQEGYDRGYDDARTQFETADSKEPETAQEREDEAR